MRYWQWNAEFLIRLPLNLRGTKAHASISDMAQCSLLARMASCPCITSPQRPSQVEARPE